MDVFDNTSKGVLDGFNMCYTGAYVTGAIDAAKYITTINSSHQGWLLVMNNDTFNSLPPELQKLFEFDSIKEFIYLYGYQFAQDELLYQQK
jgi:TRAP-type C4-dicarboxylate transport system substrate-binding protein